MLRYICWFNIYLFYAPSIYSPQRTQRRKLIPSPRPRSRGPERRLYSGLRQNDDVFFNSPPQFKALNFPGGGFGQLLDEFIPARIFVVR